MKLEIGCGGSPQPGYLHTDIRPHPSMSHVDVFCAGHELPFREQVFEEVWATGVVEHLGYKDAHAALGEWHRVLIPGGMIDFNVPDIHRWAKYLIAAIEGIGDHGGFDIGHILSTFYGWQGYRDDFHRSGWFEGALVGLVKDTGFIDIDIYRRWAYAGENDAHLCLKARKPYSNA